MDKKITIELTRQLPVTYTPAPGKKDKNPHLMQIFVMDRKTAEALHWLLEKALGKDTK